MLRYCITSCLAALTIFVSAAFAQDENNIDPDYLVTERVDPPRAASLETYQRVARQSGAETDVDYASKVDWQATPGDHILRCRATDEDGRVQPLEPLWDVSGFANNAAQKVWVHVPE